jgi:hypothetical protein
MQPNLFKLATSELTHDSFFTWLIQWAAPEHASTNTSLHLLGLAFLKLIIEEKFHPDTDNIIELKAGRQWENIDVWAEIICAERKILLILENKTFTAEHSDQLLRYKATGKKFCEEEGFELSCAYVKCGSETLKVIKAIQEKGFKTIHRKQLLEFLSANDCQHPLVKDYIQFLIELENSENAFRALPIKDWDLSCWMGFYQFIESQIPVNMWHFVNNPGGGFLNMSLNWEYWEDVAVYAQIEQGRIAFKAALSEEETGISTKELNVNKVQDLLNKHLCDFAMQEGYGFLNTSQSLWHSGSYRLIGAIKKEVWMGADEEPVNTDRIISFLKELQTFYSAFIKYLRKHNYDHLLVRPEPISDVMITD